jgi:antitoxin StbD
MDRILTTRSTSISTFKTNPQAALREAGDEPFAVLTNNKPSFYVLTPELFEQISELLFDLEIAPTVRERLQTSRKAIRVEMEEL